MTTKAEERRKHPRLPLHLSVAKLIDFNCEGFDQPSPAVLIDLSAGGLSMICFSLPKMAQRVTFQLKLPKLVSAQLHGRVVRVQRKGETYRVAVEFTEFREEWAHMIGKLAKSYTECQERWNQGERKHCPKECAYHKAFPKEES